MRDYAAEREEDDFLALVTLQESIDKLKADVASIEQWQYENRAAAAHMRTQADIVLEARKAQLSKDEAAYDMLLQKVAELIPEGDTYEPKPPKIMPETYPSQPCNTRKENMEKQPKYDGHMEKLVGLRNDVFALERALEAASIQNTNGMDVDAVVKYELRAQKMALRLAKAREDYTKALQEAALDEMQNEAGPDKEAE